MTELGTSGWLYVAVIVIAAFGLMTLLSGFGHLRHRRFVRGSFKCLGSCCIGCVAMIVLLVGINLLTWQRFTHERPVAEISFQQIKPQLFTANIHFPDNRQRHVTLRGDAWQLDARVIKWKSFATVLGFDPLYRVERISGRYNNLHQAQTAQHSVVGLSQQNGISLWRLAHNEITLLPFIDASYGSATYMPMINGAKYLVTISNTGLLTRPVNDIAYNAVKTWQ